MIVSDKLTSAATPGASQIPSHWQPPHSPFIKLNFDSATFDHGKEMGVVARNANGLCVAWLSRWVARPGFSKVAEAWVVRDAIKLAQQKGWRSVISREIVPICSINSALQSFTYNHWRCLA